MTVYRGHYILQGLSEISEEMNKDLDLAYGICQHYHSSFPCQECGRCCHQKLITILPDEVDRISSAAGVPLGEFMSKYVGFSKDGRIMLLLTDPCAFLGKDNRCRIWDDRPEVCREFPYLVSTFMSRVYLAIVNEGADVLELIDYMDGEWPCTKNIRETIVEKVAEAREIRAGRHLP
ncbi:MAG: YkgJ family cysteine cluster protein [Candidatus Methanomethylophilaceae archaeon]|jgi:Fe-S-cluster containining protein